MSMRDDNLTTAANTGTDPETTAEIGLTAPADDTVDVAALAKGIDLLDAAFGAGTPAAEAAAAVVAATPEPRMRELVGVPVLTRKGRVAALDCLFDDSSSMGRTMFRFLMAAADKMMAMLAAEIKHDAVETLVAMSLLNGGPIHGYKPLAEVPSLADYYTPLVPQTHWMKRYSEQLTGLAHQVGHYEQLGREVTGVAFLGTDGQDTEVAALMDRFPNDWEQRLAERRDNLVKLIEGYKTGGNISVAVAYMGKLLKPGDTDYEYELDGIRTARNCIGISNSRGMELEDLIIDLYLQLGFPEDMIFMPGADMKRLVEVLLAVSKSMVARSRGEKPQGNALVSRERY